MKTCSLFLDVLFRSIGRSWWVFLFFVFSYVIYVQAVGNKKDELRELVARSGKLEEERAAFKVHLAELQARVEAQQDPAFIELLLKEGLGVVPEGQVKVHFKRRNLSQ